MRVRKPFIEISGQWIPFWSVKSVHRSGYHTPTGRVEHTNVETTSYKFQLDTPVEEILDAVAEAAG